MTGTDSAPMLGSLSGHFAKAALLVSIRGELWGQPLRPSVLWPLWKEPGQSLDLDSGGSPSTGAFAHFAPSWIILCAMARTMMYSLNHRCHNRIPSVVCYLLHLVSLNGLSFTSVN